MERKALQKFLRDLADAMGHREPQDSHHLETQLKDVEWARWVSQADGAHAICVVCGWEETHDDTCPVNNLLRIKVPV